MSGQPSVLQVVILRDALLVGTEVLLPGSYVIGSSKEADLHLNDPTVDASHAVLYFQNGKAAIQDSNSRSGTWVNGHRVTACEVRSVDEIGCGPFTLKVKVLAQKGAHKPSPPPEVAALLQGTPQPQPSSARADPVKPPPGPAAVPSPALPPPGQPNATMLSARRLAAVAAPAQMPATLPGRVPHLRAVTPPPAYDGEAATEAISLPTALPDVTMPSASPPPRPKRTSAARNAPAVPKVDAAEVKGRPRLFIELYWGQVRRDARSFAALPPKRPLVAGPDESAMLPMYGFTLGEPFILADQWGDVFRLFVPAKASVESRQRDGSFIPLSPEQLKHDGPRRYVDLPNGAAVRLSEGQMSLVAYVQPAQKRPFALPRVPVMLLFLLLVFGAGFGAFLYYGPRPYEAPDFQAKNLNPVAVRLIAPEPKKKEEAQKKAAELKAKAEQKAPLSKADKAVKKLEQKLPPAVAKTTPLKAVAKLTAAGPAMNELLAAVDKLGGGPGSKNAKGFKLSGLIGKAPLANAGLGTFGLGGGGGGGFGAKGAETLRGAGGGGVGALGVRSFGRGAVGGTVQRASGARIGVSQGSIDREAVARVVNAHLGEVRACYERALLKDPSLAGKVVLEWAISTSGKVTAAKTKSSSLQNASVESCILSNLKTWTFPPAKGGMVIVSYPFLFNSVGY